MQAAQQVWGQFESAKAIEFGDLREQAFEANPPWIGREFGERGALTVIGQKRVQPLPDLGIETTSDNPQCGGVVCGVLPSTTF
jgi:hypothetical protein